MGQSTLTWAVASCIWLSCGAQGQDAAASLRGFAAGAPSSATTAIVKCTTSVGDLTIDVKGHWAPRGADRFLTMVDAGWFTNLYMPRVVRHYLTQFGPRLPTSKLLKPVRFGRLEDDPPLTKWFGKNQNISKGTMFYAGSGTDSRGTDLCIAFCPLKNCAALGTEKWETPFAVIRELERLDAIDQRICTPLCKGRPCGPTEGPPDEHKNCDMPPFGIGPGTGTVSRGEAFLNKEYPLMQHFIGCEVSWRNAEHAAALLKGPATADEVDDDQT